MCSRDLCKFWKPIYARALFLQILESDLHESSNCAAYENINYTGGWICADWIWPTEYPLQKNICVSRRGPPNSILWTTRTVIKGSLIFIFFSCLVSKNIYSSQGIQWCWPFGSSIPLIFWSLILIIFHFSSCLISAPNLLVPWFG